MSNEDEEEQIYVGQDLAFITIEIDDNLFKEELFNLRNIYWQI
jgi:hypothetical protein